MATAATELLEKQVADHIEDIGEDIIMSQIEDIKSDFLDGDWENDFDDEYEAYAETGRGEAESQILQAHAQDILGANATSKEISAFMQEMACQLGISLD
jgi:hypothetical protein